MLRFVRACDWFRRLRPMPYVEAAVNFPQIAARPLDEGLRVLHADGRVDVAIDAVRAVMLRTPLGALVGWLLFVPPIRSVGARAYAHVAARRATTACALPPRAP